MPEVLRVKEPSIQEVGAGSKHWWVVTDGMGLTYTFWTEAQAFNALDAFHRQYLTIKPGGFKPKPELWYTLASEYNGPERDLYDFHTDDLDDEAEAALAERGENPEDDD